MAYKRLNITVDPRTPRKLKTLADHYKRSMSNVVDVLIQNEYERLKGNKPKISEDIIRNKIDNL